jgi:hypothetical protein
MAHGTHVQISIDLRVMETMGRCQQLNTLYLQNIEAASIRRDGGNHAQRNKHNERTRSFPSLLGSSAKDALPPRAV